MCLKIQGLDLWYIVPASRTLLNLLNFTSNTLYNCLTNA